eukprot:320146-Ditylum_brightwellii.AAC.1
MPKTVEDAYEIDKKTGTKCWARAIEKELKNVQLAFNILEKDESVPVGFQHIDFHWVFDIKMDFTRKA